VSGFIYHIATAADWARARRDGAYTTSTRGRTLREEGFLEARPLATGTDGEFTLTPAPA